MDQSSLQHDDILYNQIEEAYGKVVYTYTTHIIHAGRLYKRNSRLKWLQIILSALSTGGIFSVIFINKFAVKVLTALCSTAMLVLTSYFKDRDLSAIYRQHVETSNKLWGARENYLSFLVDYPYLSDQERKNRRDVLQQEVSAIYKEAPLTDSKSYALAQKALKEKESQFFTREELNQMLPQLLRR